MTRSLWFVRHAQSEYNKKKLFTGWHDPSLTEHGVTMAQELKKEVDSETFSHVYSSPLQRAYQTAKILVDEKRILVDDRIKERSYGDWSAKNKDQVKDIEGEDNYKLTKGVLLDTDLDESDWDGLIEDFKRTVREKRVILVNF